MTKPFLGLLQIVFFLITAPPTQGQQPTKVSRIGYLSGDTLAASERRVEAFRQGLRDLGYVEGKNIVVEWRLGERLFERQREVAVELARQARRRRRRRVGRYTRSQGGERFNSDCHG